MRIVEKKIETTTILSLLKRTQICTAQVRHIQARCESAGQGRGIPGFREGLVFGQVKDGVYFADSSCNLGSCSIRSLNYH